MKSNLTLVKDATVEGVVRVQMRMSRHLASKKARIGALAMVVLAETLVPATALAANCSTGGAADKLVKFIKQAAQFMIYLGGAAALLMFSVGAVFIIAGGNPQRVNKGMKMIHNAVIGLVILVAGVFIATIIDLFVNSATGGQTNDTCAKKSISSL